MGTNGITNDLNLNLVDEWAIVHLPSYSCDITYFPGALIRYGSPCGISEFELEFDLASTEGMFLSQAIKDLDLKLFDRGVHSELITEFLSH